MSNDRIYIRPELTPQGLREASIQMYRDLTGKEPTAEELAEIDVSLQEDVNRNLSVDEE